MPTSIKIGEITTLGTEQSLTSVPEDVFFKDKAKGILIPDRIPLPDDVQSWKRARFLNEDVHFAYGKGSIYLLADTTNFGYSLFKFVSTPENDELYKVAYSGGVRIIENERSSIIMNGSLKDIANQYSGGTAQRVNPINFNQGAPAMAAISGEGVSRSIDPRRLHTEIVTKGFVAGYVMANAPAITMSLARKKAKDGTVTANILAKESKPSRCLAVLIALPAGCVQRSGVLATPDDIRAGNVEYVNSNEMLYQSFSVNAAIGYLSSFGGKLPEYAPNVLDKNTKHWTADDILNGKPEVTFVYVHATQNKSRNSRSGEAFRFSLKSTSGRRSLYTEGNHVCLRALEHTSTKCDSEKKAYELNEIAFGAWRYRRKKSEPDNALTKAMAECPSYIWNAQYEIDGQVKQGIGSAFFMAGSSVTSESGENITARPLTYFPWYQTGDQRTPVGTRVDRIVTRKFRAAEGDKKENMVTVPLYFKDNPNDPMFKPYSRFVDYITSQGFISRDKLVALGTRSSKAKGRSLSLTPDQQSSLQHFLQREDIEAEILSVRDAAADRAVLRAQQVG